jgi:hypothetical protein
MQLEQQVVSLELAKKLKELGVKQESLWSWWVATDRDDTPALNRSSQKDCPTCGHPRAPYFEEIAAFTVAELGEILPPHWMTTKGTKGIKLLWWKESPEPYYQETRHVKKMDAGVNDASEADARAKMLIYLIENKLIDLRQPAAPEK